uniref:Uncharacterized protein n=1 Tax=Triticum urartu TaxID=4572 RepID=A0A8R7Q4W9_TRIUA
MSLPFKSLCRSRPRSPISRRRGRRPGRSGASLVDDGYSHGTCSLPRPLLPRHPCRLAPSPGHPTSRCASSSATGPPLPPRSPPPWWPQAARPLSCIFYIWRQPGTGLVRRDAATVSSSPVLLDPIISHRRQAGGPRSPRLLYLAGSAASARSSMSNKH